MQVPGYILSLLCLWLMNYPWKFTVNNNNVIGDLKTNALQILLHSSRKKNKATNWARHYTGDFVWDCVCVCILARENIVDGSRPSLWNSIAFNGIAVFSINCFGLEPILAAEFFKAQKGKAAKYLSHTIYSHIFQKQHLIWCKTQSPYS